jgi:ActR/RegA family two-component response regulator/predicted Ser/Thr protein kinase
MRFIIVDDSTETRRRLADMVRARWPEAETEEWDPRRQGIPAGGLADCSAVLLDTHPAGQDGFGWLAEMRRQPDSPPVVLMTERGGEMLAVKAIKAGASDFLAKNALTPELLGRSLEDALREREARRAERTGTDPDFLRTVRIEALKAGSPVKPGAVQVPGYRSLRKIGEGGMGQVFLAEREHDGLQLVLKVLGPALRGDQVFLQRFVREYKLIASIEAEHVARIYDQGFSGEHPYIAMEYLSGGTLAARMREGLTSLAALRLTSQIARALDVVHGHGIVHRDLKPQNIMFRADRRPVIVDFGLAKDLGGDSALTQYGHVMATPRYMSPEQCLGHPADHRSDLYSLGVVFYEMLTGRQMFEAASPADLVLLHVSGEVPPLPPRLAGYQTIVDRLIAKDPSKRFQSARELFATIAI